MRWAYAGDDRGRTVPLSDWPSGLDKPPDDIEVVVDLQD
jgi:hypothetical protein